MAAYEVWDRQPSESSRSYALFAHYRDAGPMERTLAKVARDFGRSVYTIEDIARRHNWVPRVQQWDAENERIKRAAVIKGLESMARRQVLAGQLMMSKGLKRLQSMNDDEVALLSVWEATRLVESGNRLERMGYGEPETLAPAVTVFAGADTTLADILRRDPTRVGAVVTLLDELRKVVPELGQGAPVYYEGQAEEVEIAELLAEDVDETEEVRDAEEPE